MPRFAVYSDLHYEFGSQFEPPAALRGKVDGAILAGDISAFPTVIKRARQISDALDAPAVLICGNHEFYGYVIEDVLEKLRDQADDRVRFLECDSTEIAGARILGTTLWTDYQINPEKRTEALTEMKRMMADYREISRIIRDNRTARIDTDYLLAEHNKSRAWLASELEKPSDGPTVVVSHTAPSRKSFVRHNPNMLIAAAFASDLDSFINDHEIAMWVHGHTHESVDYKIGKTRVVSNPYGYKSLYELNPEFIPDFVIEV